MERIPVYLDLSPEIQQLFDDNAIDLEAVLAAEGINAEVRADLAPFEQEQDARTRDLVTMILVSGAAASLAILAISNLIRTLQQGPHLVQYETLEEIRDADGNVLLDDQGRPIFKRVPHHELLQSQNGDRSTNLEIGLDLKNGLSVKYGTSEEQG